jgi:hypothetical protein
MDASGFLNPMSESSSKIRVGDRHWAAAVRTVIASKKIVMMFGANLSGLFGGVIWAV